MNEFEKFDSRGKLKRKIIYVYDAKKQLKTFTVSNGKEKQIQSYFYNYNELGFLEKLLSFNGKGKPLFETNYSYTYGEKVELKP